MAEEKIVDSTSCEMAKKLIGDNSCEEEIAKLDARNKEILERVNKLKILHEDIVVINRHDSDTISFLALDELNREGRRRSSWYGTVIKVSEIDCGDTVREGKKKKIKEGDIIIFNPESAYSLNIAKFPEIWILHIDSILMNDSGFDYMEAKKENIRKMHEIRLAQKSFNNNSVIAPNSGIIFKKR